MRDVARQWRRLADDAEAGSDSPLPLVASLGLPMAKRDQEHYEIARRFGVDRAFTRSEFNRLYREEYTQRISAPTPSDYCVNLNPKVAVRCPKFLRWLGRGRYEFIGGSD
jgi:hypothetical protein